MAAIWFSLATISSFTKLLLLMLCICGIGYYCFAIYSTLTFRRQAIPEKSGFCPPVSILKPLCGVEPTTYQNLASFCRQDYPEYQIIFAVRNLADPSIKVVEQLLADLPNVDIELALGDRAVGTNPKVNNLINAVQFAKHDILFIADSDILVEPNYLKSVVQPFQEPSVGVVTCLYRSLAKGCAASLEAIAIATNLISNVLAARQLREINFALGATIAIRRSVLDEIGGFQSVVDYLADDYQLGYLPTQTGYRVSLSRYVVTHVLSATTMRDSFLRQTRWNQAIRASDPAGYVGLIFTHGFVLSLGFLYITGGSWQGWLLAALALGCKLFLAWIVGIDLLEDSATQKGWWLLPICDCISFGLWCAGLVENTVIWRGQQFQVSAAGKLIAISTQDYISSSNLPNWTETEES